MGKIKGAIKINTDRCKGCNLCAVACPFNLLLMSKNKVNKHGYQYCEQINPEQCTGCAACAIVCPDACITVYRKKEEK